MINSELKTLPLNINKVVLPLASGYTQAGDLLVQCGDKVQKNQALTKVLPHNDYSVAVHSPIDGVVTNIDYLPNLHSLGHLNKLTKVLSIVIKSEEEETEITNSIGLEKSIADNLTYDRLIAILANYGIVGLGGAGFPTNKKLQTQNINTIIINAMECESPIDVDNCLINNYSDNIIAGLIILNNILKPNQIIIGIKKDYAESINSLKLALEKYTEHQQANNIFIQILDGGYPNGYSKSLIKLITKQELPARNHSMERGIICLNVATVFSIEQAINHQQPVINRIVTITGGLIDKPGNYLLPIGTPITHILQAFDIDKNRRDLSVRIGGDYMGYELYNAKNNHHFENLSFLDNIAIEKTTQAISINNIAEQIHDKPYNACIKCGFCETVCPMGLIPQQLFWYGQKINQDNNHDILDKYYISNCIECGMCDNACPSDIPLTAIFKNLKTEIQYNKYKKTHAEQAQLYFEQKTQRQEAKINQTNTTVDKINTQSLLQAALTLAKNKKQKTN